MNLDKGYMINHYISPICHYHKIHPQATYKVVDEGYDWYLLKNGLFIPKFIDKDYDDIEMSEDYEEFEAPYQILHI